MAARHEQAAETPPRLAAAGTKKQNEGEEQQPAAGDPQPGRRPALPSHSGWTGPGAGTSVARRRSRPGPKRGEAGLPTPARWGVGCGGHLAPPITSHSDPSPCQLWPGMPSNPQFKGGLSPPPTGGSGGGAPAGLTVCKSGPQRPRVLQEDRSRASSLWKSRQSS